MRSVVTILASVAALSLAPVCAGADPAANTTTAKRVFLEKMGKGRFVDGRIVEEWSIIDLAALNRQLM